MYLLGDGVPADRVAAQKWFSIAARRGSDVGRYLSARLGATLSAAELATATAAADEWLARGPAVMD
jgi:TPR repeat protein